MDLAQVLHGLGLEDKEPEVYLTLLKTPGVQPASVIANRLDMNRSTVYKTLIKLAQKGLVTKSQRAGITCFFAEDPENKLKFLIEHQQQELQRMNQKILDALPSITLNPEASQVALPRIRYYEGIEGIKQVYEAVLKEGEDVHRYGNINKIYEALGIYTDEYISKRKKIGFKTFAIEPLTKKNPKKMKRLTKENREVLFIPQEFFPIEGEVRVFGNKVAIISLRKESPIGVIIESRTIAKMFLSIFMLTWKNYAGKAVRGK